LNAEAPSEIPKGEWDLVAGTTEVLMKSAKIQSTGDPVLFHTLCQSLPQSLVYLGDTARSYLTNMISSHVTLPICKKVAGAAATSGQEGFHGHAHRFTPKFDLFIFVFVCFLFCFRPFD